MSVQTITTAAGERLVVLPEAEYLALIEAAEDAADRQSVADFRRRLTAGKEELIPSVIVDRLLGGENRIRVWREHRGLTPGELADRAGLKQPYLLQIETGKREGSVEALRALAAALSVTLDDLAGMA